MVQSPAITLLCHDSLTKIPSSQINRRTTFSFGGTANYEHSIFPFLFFLCKSDKLVLLLVVYCLSGSMLVTMDHTLQKNGLILLEEEKMVRF